MNKLILTVGLPRSGKSTWAQGQALPIVNPDAIRLAIYDQPFIGKAEPYVWLVAHTMVEALFLAGHITVILDATNTTRKRRDEWKSGKWICEFMVFSTPKEVCLSRTNDAGLIEAIERMAEGYEPVGWNEQ